MEYTSYNKENAFSEEFKQMLRLHGAYATSVIGTLYASGQPDIDCTSIYGQNTKIELKVYRGLELPTREAVLKLLRGPQVNVIIHQLMKRKCNCVLVAQIGAKPDTCAVVSSEKISFDSIERVATVIARLPYGVYTPYQ